MVTGHLVTPEEDASLLTYLTRSHGLRGRFQDAQEVPLAPPGLRAAPRPSHPQVVLPSAIVAHLRWSCHGSFLPEASLPIDL